MKERREIDKAPSELSWLSEEITSYLYMNGFVLNKESNNTSSGVIHTPMVIYPTPVRTLNK
jgi:hypothetical protein